MKLRVYQENLDMGIEKENEQFTLLLSHLKNRLEKFMRRDLIKVTHYKNSKAGKTNRSEKGLQLLSNVENSKDLNNTTASSKFDFKSFAKIEVPVRVKSLDKRIGSRPNLNNTQDAKIIDIDRPKINTGLSFSNYKRNLLHQPSSTRKNNFNLSMVRMDAHRHKREIQKLKDRKVQLQMSEIMKNWDKNNAKLKSNQLLKFERMSISKLKNASNKLQFKRMAFQPKNMLKTTKKIKENIDIQANVSLNSPSRSPKRKTNDDDEVDEEIEEEENTSYDMFPISSDQDLDENEQNQTFKSKYLA